MNRKVHTNNLMTSNRSRNQLHASKLEDYISSSRAPHKTFKDLKSMTWALKQTTQCDKCPWKVSTDPYDIPNRCKVEKHQALRDTIAEPGALNFSNTIPVMTCHEAHEAHCIGWMAHELGRGNNIPLRLEMMTCTNRQEMRIVGDQHPNFESTLPRIRKEKTNG